MKIKDLYEKETIPITNVLHYTVEYNSLYSEICCSIRKSRDNISLIQYHKNKLGKQSCTFNGYGERLWVWNKPEYRLFVGKNKGIILEVNESALKINCINAIRAYIKDMDLNIEIIL